MLTNENPLNDIETTTVAPEAPSPDKLMQTLEKERKLRAEYEAKYKSSAEREKNFESQLEQYKSVEPAKYQEMLKNEEARREQDLIQQKQYEQLKSESLLRIKKKDEEVETYKNKYDNLLVEQAFKQAFYDRGGRRQVSGALDGESIAPVDTALAPLRSRLKVLDGEVVITDSFGTPETMPDGSKKTLEVKLEELKKNGWGFLFSPESGASGSGSVGNSGRSGHPPSGAKVYSASSARTGSAKMADIASGAAHVVQ